MSVLRKVIRKIKHLQLKHCSPEKRPELLRKQLYHIGNGVRLWTYDFGTEPYLISIHDNVTVASNVRFINHDVSVFTIHRYLGLQDDYIIDKVNKIELLENCMVGALSIIMPGVVVGRNSIVAAGSIVTKSIPDNEVWGGTCTLFNEYRYLCAETV